MDYNRNYDRPINKKYLEKQFQIYDAYSKMKYSPNEVLKSFNGTIIKDEKTISKVSNLAFNEEGNINIYNDDGSYIATRLSGDDDLNDLI